MKNFKIALIMSMITITSFVIYSCAKENTKDIMASSPSAELRTTPNIVGHLATSGPVLTVNVSTYLGLWNNVLNSSGGSVNLTSLAIETFDGNYYLVARGNGIKSTKKLNVDDNGNFSGDTVTCTTKDCSDTPDCVPAGYTCTKCPNNGVCTKTITSTTF